jgi:ligand-binding sensor domain-containing protein/signal transduction histidine kinase/DNA-binding response OmpR family regulator
LCIKENRFVYLRMRSVQCMFRIAISFLLGIITLLAAAQDNIRFSHLTTKDGMSQNSVLCIHQDDYGFMWFGTRDGLNLYDGVGFKTFYHSYTDENTLSSSYINHISEDSNGDLWISTTNGLNRYKRYAERFERYYIPGIEGESSVFFSFQDSYGTLWIGASDGLFVFDWETETLKPYEFKNISGSFPDRQVSCILQDHKGFIIFGTYSNGIFFYDPINSAIKNLNTHSEPSLSSNNVQSIVEDNDQNIWIASDGGGVNIWNRSANEITKMNLESHPELSSNVVRTLLSDGDQNIWIGSFNGLSVFNRETQTLSIVESNEHNPYSLNNNAIRSLFQDNKGTVWVGTYFGGVNIYDHVNQRFKHHNYTPELEVPLDYNAISAIVEDPNLSLWIGTDRGGLNHYNYTTRRYSYYLPDDEISDAEPMFTIKSLLQQDEGTLWLGTHRRGLYRFDIPSGKFRRIPLPVSGESVTSLTNSVINSMHWDSKGYMWLCTRSYGGLYKFDPDDEIIVPFVMQDKIHDLLGNTHVRSVFQDNFGNVWIATRGKGIIIFNEENGFLDHFYHNPMQPGSLRTNHIYQIEQDKNGEIWVATDGAGIARFDRMSGSFDFSVSGEGLLNNKVLGILVDDYDNLWFSTIKGISRYHKKDSLFKNYDYKAGLPISELAEGAFHKGRYSGKLYFGGVDGFIEISPQSFIDNDHIPPVIISGFKLFSEDIKPSDGSGIMQKSILHTNEIRLKYNQSIFTIDFVALNFTHPASNQYAYMLEGLENSWNYVGSQNFATYTLLNSGKYTFKVKAANNDGLWNDEPATLDIIILPPPWQTWWAYLIYCLLIAVILYFIRFFILKNEQYKNSTIINEMQKAKLQEINEAKIDFFTQVSYELRTPLTLIIAPIKELVKTRGMKHEVREKISLIRDNAQLLNQLVDQILDFRKLETGKEKLRVSHEDWVSHIRNITSHFTSYSTYRNISFSFRSAKRNIFGMIDTALVGKVLFNLISHAFKNTPDKGKIKLTVAEANLNEAPERLTDKYQNYKQTGNAFPAGQDIIIITIEDNGIGYTRDEMESIFAKFYDMQGANSARTGIGLYIVNNIVHLHRGCIEVSSEKHKGTVFSLVFPLAKGSYSQSEIIDKPSTELSDIYKPLMPTTLEITSQQTTLDENAPNLLVIEDQPELSNYMNSILRNEYHIRSATAVNDAFSIMRTELPDIILCDINQKPSDVIKLCLRLKRIKVLESVPIVIISANQSEEFRIQSYEAGANAFILKPFTPDLLKVRIKSLLTDKKNEKIQGEIDLASKFISGADEKLLRNIDSIIRKSLSDPRLSVETLSKMIGLSRAQFYRKIKELTGLTVVEYIRSKRLDEAAFLLRQDKLSIKEVVGLTGFGDMDYFRTHFKKKFGTTPSNYMEQERNKKQ